MTIIFREMEIEDYSEVTQLWHKSDIVMNYADTIEDISCFLKRNVGFSFVALKGSQIIGVVLCGNDARHGYLCHLCVDFSYRKRGIAKQLEKHALSALSVANVKNCHILVNADSDATVNFWEKNGWIKRDEFALMTKWTGKDFSR